MDESTNTTAKRKLVPLLPNTLLKKSKYNNHSLTSNELVEIKLEVDQIVNNMNPSVSESDLKTTNNNNFNHHQLVDLNAAGTTLTDQEDDLVLSPQVTNLIINKNPPNYSDQPKPRHLKSCSRCRKHKTKCDFIDTSPNPCSSCSKKGLVCQLVTVIPVKRSNIIKNLRTNIQDLQDIVDRLIIRDKYLKQVCNEKGLKIDGLVDINQVTRFEDLYSAFHCSNLAEDHNSKSTSSSPSPHVFTPPTEYIKSEFNSENGNGVQNLTPLNLSNDITQNEFLMMTTPPQSNSDLSSDTESTSASSIGAATSSSSASASLAGKSCSSSAVSSSSGTKDSVIPINLEVPPVTEMDHFSFKMDNFKYSIDLSTAQSLLDKFNVNHLRFLPIMNQVNSPTDLYNLSRLLFWSIIFVTTYNPLIYSYVQKELIKLTWLQTPKSINIVQSILIIASFPLIESIDDDISHNEVEYDDSIFKWLTLAKDICLQIGINRGNQFLFEFSRRIDTTNYSELLRGKIWSMVYILGNQWSFKLGLPWNQKIDWYINSTNSKLQKIDIEEDKKSLNDYYFLKVLEITTLNSNIIEQLGKSFKSLDGLIDDDTLLLNSICSWDFKLSQYRKSLEEYNELHEDVLKKDHNLYISILLDQCDLTLALFGIGIKDNSDINLQLFHSERAIKTSIRIIDKSIELSKISSSNNLSNFPILIRSILELSSLVLIRLHYSPFIITTTSSLSDELSRCFKFLLTLQNYTDVKKTLKIMMKIDKYFKLKPDFFWNRSGVVNHVRSHLAQGVYFELRWLIDEFELKEERNLCLDSKERDQEQEDDDVEDDVESPSIDEFFINKFGKEITGNRNYNKLLHRLSDGQSLGLFEMYQDSNLSNERGTHSEAGIELTKVYDDSKGTGIEYIPLKSTTNVDTQDTGNGKTKPESTTPLTSISDSTSTEQSTAGVPGSVAKVDYIDKLVNCDLIDMNTKTEEENLDALKNILKGIDWITA